MGKQITTRIQNKIDSFTDWENTSSSNNGNFIPLKGELIIYAEEGKQPRLKVGNGKTKAAELKYVVTEATSSTYNLPSKRSTYIPEELKIEEHTQTYSKEDIFDNFNIELSTVNKHIVIYVKSDLLDKVNLIKVTTSDNNIVDAKIVTSKTIALNYISEGTASVKVTFESLNLNVIQDGEVELNINCKGKLKLNDCSWEDIYNYTVNGLAGELFDIGDIKSIKNFSLTGYPATLNIMLVHIDGTKMFFQGFKNLENNKNVVFESVYLDKSSQRGWPDVELSEVTCSNFETALINSGLPYDYLCSIDNKKITIPSVANLTDTTIYQDIYFDYFSAGNSREYYINNIPTTYWLKDFNIVDNTVQTYYGPDNITSNNDVERGFIPLFVIGKD